MFVAIFGKIIVILIAAVLKPSEVYAQQDIYRELRRRMVEEQIIARGINNEQVLTAVSKVARHQFVPKTLQQFAYSDRPLPIGYEQTISQPYIVALMTELADLHPQDKVLEIGTGSGYQAAILAEIAQEVYTIEILQPLADLSRERLKNLGYQNIQVKCGDGYLGWEEFAPYDAIIVTAAPEQVPTALIEQLKIGGRLVIPVGTFYQELKLITKWETKIEEKLIIPVRFVPMVHGQPQAGTEKIKR